MASVAISSITSPAGSIPKPAPIGKSTPTTYLSDGNPKYTCDCFRLAPDNSAFTQSTILRRCCAIKSLERSKPPLIKISFINNCFILKQITIKYKNLCHNPPH
ncbi:hypothetical protein [Moraxella lacunata]|uniref:hypothetical protein n=1 Tax=Moraxella lacunata TaxID=477 RepID=UPI003EE40CD5